MAPDNSFWHAALLYINRPNLLNKRLIGAKLERFWQFPNENYDIEQFLSTPNFKTSIKHLDSIFIICDKNNKNLLNFCDPTNELQHQRPILILRKLFRKQSLKSLLKCSTSSDQSNNIEYDFVCLWPLLNKFIIVPLDVEPGFNVNIRQDENSSHVQINIRNGNDDIAFALKLIDDVDKAQNCDKQNFHLELSFPSLVPNEENGKESQLWLKNVFTNKFERWIRQQRQNVEITNKNNSKHKVKRKEQEKSKNNDKYNNRDNKNLEGSIRNISVENYCENYNRLKQKYVQPLMRIWTTIENTDPIKFIYEDIAIAAYLITLWQEEMEKFDTKFQQRKQTFADIGCGNGLLVYILTQEGYDGYGVDLRRRNIWYLYNNDDDDDKERKKVRLIEMKIDLFEYETTDDFGLPHCDWMIGNHSDELTPWILYMASMQNTQTRVFLLPCCCYNLDGFKFQRTTEPSTKSQYQCYIDFLESLCYQFGFAQCQRDKLRIPSTKRICLICTGRTYLMSLVSDNNIINDSSGEQKNIGKQNDESIEWQQKRRQIVRQSLQKQNDYHQRKRLRETKEPVRNCTHIDQNIKQEIISRLSNALISQTDNDNDPYDGSSLSFQEAIALLDCNNHNDDDDDDDRDKDRIRKHLKNQCGGLQTFIRNHKFIFTIRDGRIRFQSIDYLRIWNQNKDNDPNGEQMKPTKKDCWFYRNHPRGCPLLANECRFRHPI